MVGALLVFSITASIGDHLIDLWLVKEFDQSLLAKAKVLVTLTVDSTEAPELNFADEFMPEYSIEESPHYFQFWYSDGGIMQRSKSLGGSDLTREESGSGDPVYYDHALPNGQTGRHVTLSFMPQFKDESLRTPDLLSTQTPVTLTVAVPRSNLDEVLIIADLTVTLAILIVVILMMLVVRVVVIRGFSPLARIQAEMAEFDLHSNSAALKTDNLPVELEGIVYNFNELMKRIQEGLARERQFSADVAHELRTPIAEIRNIADVALRWPENLHIDPGPLSDIRDASIQMQRLVETLLSIAHTDRNKLSIVFETVLVDQLLMEVIERHKAEAQQRSLSWDIDLEPGCTIWAGPFELEQIVDNLIANATRYCPEGHQIKVSCQSTASSTQILVANFAPDLSRADLSQMYDRMWQKDSSRTSCSNFGLGLSLVAGYASATNLGIETSLDDKHVLSIKLTGPRCVAQDRL